MLYFHALMNGLAELPDSDPQLRQDIKARAQKDGWPAMHAELARLDPAAAARIHPNDPQRIQRALEVCWLSGAQLSRLQSERTPPLGDLRVSKVILCPSERAKLHRRVAQRCHSLVEAVPSLLGEVQCDEEAHRSESPIFFRMIHRRESPTAAPDLQNTTSGNPRRICGSSRGLYNRIYPRDRAVHILCGGTPPEGETNGSCLQGSEKAMHLGSTVETGSGEYAPLLLQLHP
jgi:hypothetical protein